LQMGALFPFVVVLLLLLLVFPARPGLGGN